MQQDLVVAHQHQLESLAQGVAAVSHHALPGGCGLRSRRRGVDPGLHRARAIATRQPGARPVAHHAVAVRDRSALDGNADAGIGVVDECSGGTQRRADQVLTWPSIA